MNTKKKKIIGYTQGTFDTLHYGHVRLLKQAKELCDFLIVGVNSDDLVFQYKNTNTIIKENERAEIVGSIKYVDEVFIVDSLDKIQHLNRFKYDVIFIGDDWKGNDRWKATEKELSKYGIPVVFLKHTPNVSTTMVKEKMKSNKI